MSQYKNAALIINLGTPDAPESREVGRYLREFLMDPLVVDINPVLRFMLVNGVIVPFRSPKSAEAYRSIWTDEGSPLLIHTQNLASKVRKLNSDTFDQIEIAMRYGSPSIRSALINLKELGVETITIMPMYPQYSLAATESSIQAVKTTLESLSYSPELKWVDAFFSEDAFLDPLAKLITQTRESELLDFVLFSYHGIPEHQVQKTDPSGKHCLIEENCCDKPSVDNTHCYRFQCYETTRKLQQKCELDASNSTTSFQSRLGRRPWIKPYTDMILSELIGKGVQRLGVVCPSFVADCLETLEEIAIRAAEDWESLGGEKLVLIPCVNDDDDWAKGTYDLLKRSMTESL